MRFIASFRLTFNDRILLFLLGDVLGFSDRRFLLKPLLRKGFRRNDKCFLMKGRGRLNVAGVLRPATFSLPLLNHHKAVIPMPLLRQRNLIML